MYSHFYYLYFLFFSLYYLFYFCLSYLNNNTNYILTCLLKWILLIELPLYNNLDKYEAANAKSVLTVLAANNNFPTMLRNTVASDSESFKPSSIELTFERSGVETALHSFIVV